MAKGRIKRLLSEARTQMQQVQTVQPVVCALCERPIPSALREAHHLIPKSRGGLVTVFLHRACHKQIHALFTETELAQKYASPQALRAHPEIARFIHWVKAKPNDFNPPARRARRKGQLSLPD